MARVRTACVTASKATLDAVGDVDALGEEGKELHFSLSAKEVTVAETNGMVTPQEVLAVAGSRSAEALVCPAA